MAVCYIRLPSLSKSLVLSKSRLEEYQSYIDLAVEIFQAQNPQLISFLKDFLTCLPSPSYVEQVLIVAIERLSKINLESCNWLVNNHHLLMPELDLIELAKACQKARLEENQLMLGEDFKFIGKNQLHLNPRAKEVLLTSTNEVNLITVISQGKNLIEVELSIDNILVALLREKVLLIQDLSD
jgi:hypothetical protein